MRSTVPVSILTLTSRTWAWNGFWRRLAWRSGRRPTRSHRMTPPSGVGGGTASSSSTVSGVLVLNRVTIRQPAACNSAHQP